MSGNLTVVAPIIPASATLISAVAYPVLKGRRERRRERERHAEERAAERRELDYEHRRAEVFELMSMARALVLTLVEWSTANIQEDQERYPVLRDDIKAQENAFETFYRTLETVCVDIEVVREAELFLRHERFARSTSNWGTDRSWKPTIAVEQERLPALLAACRRELGMPESDGPPQPKRMKPFKPRRPSDPFEALRSKE